MADVQVKHHNSSCSKMSRAGAELVNWKVWQRISMNCARIGNRKLRGYEFYQSSRLLHCVNTRNIADTSHQKSSKLILININYINFIFTELEGNNINWWQNQAVVSLHLKFNWSDNCCMMILNLSGDLLKDDVAGGNVLARYVSSSWNISRQNIQSWC